MTEDHLCSKGGKSVHLFFEAIDIHQWHPSVSFCFSWFLGLCTPFFYVPDEGISGLVAGFLILVRAHNDRSSRP